MLSSTQIVICQMPPEWVNLFWGSGDMIICSTTSSPNTDISSGGGGPAQPRGSTCAHGLPWQHIIMLAGTLWCLHEDTLTLVYETNPGAEFCKFWKKNFDWGLFDLWRNAQTVLQNGWNYIFQPQNRKKSASVNFISYIPIDNVEYCPTLLTQWTQNLATNREEGVERRIQSGSE